MISDGEQPQFDFERALGVLGNLGMIEHRRGNITAAIETLSRSIRYTRDHGSIANLCTALVRLADAQVDAGQVADGRLSILEALELARRLRMAEELTGCRQLLDRIGEFATDAQ